MTLRRAVIFFFYFFPVFIFVQLAYGLVVREPYPSFMMPGFSRIDNDGTNYQLIDRRIVAISENSDTTVFELDILETSVSKIAISRMIDLAFFDPGNAKIENSAQKKYYKIIRSFMGSENYKNYVLDVRYPPVDQMSISKFKKWFLENIEKGTPGTSDQILLQRIEETRDFKSGKVLNIRLLDEIRLTDD